MADPLRRDRQRLLHLLRELSFERRSVTLASGRPSDFYIDCRRTALTAEGHYLIGRLLLEAIRRLVLRHNPAIITCVDRYSLASIRGGSPGILRELTPDVIVFDESFVGRAVPFAAFTARRSLFAAWNRPGKSTFHSTTFQPNTSRESVA